MKARGVPASLLVCTLDVCLLHRKDVKLDKLERKLPEPLVERIQRLIRKGSGRDQQLVAIGSK
jgi:hypothetical protein